MNKGYSDFNRSVDREPNNGLGMRIIPEMSYNDKNAIEAQTRTTKARVVALVISKGNPPETISCCSKQICLKT
jgi:hypothetical protein